MPTLEETRRFFDAIASRYDRAYAPPADVTRARMKRVLAVLGTPKRVLDLGVGTGRELPALLDAGHAVTGLECSDQMIALCNQRARTIDITRADLWEPLPWNNGAFDAVISLFGTLAHPPNAHAVSRFGHEVQRVLVAQGLFYFEVPTTSWLDTIVKPGENKPRHEDPVSRVGIEIIGMTEAEWSVALPDFDLSFDRSDANELAVVARVFR